MKIEKRTEYRYVFYDLIYTGHELYIRILICTDNLEKNNKMLTTREFFISFIATSLIICQGINSPLLSENAPNLFEQEIKSSQKVKFQNKNNLKATPEKLEFDTKVGEALATGEDKDGILKSSELSVIHLPSKSKKMGADIINIGKKFKVGHINTLKRIISSYIQKSFDYDERQSDILAYYTLYYNVLHRKNIKYFQSKYDANIIKSMNPKMVGISKKYTEWPGNTQIIIPLNKNILKNKKTDVTISELKDSVNKDLTKKKKGTEMKDDLNSLLKDKLAEEKKAVDEKKKQAEDKISDITKNQIITEEKLKKDNIPAEEKEKLEKDKVSLLKEKESLVKEKKELDKKEQEIQKTQKQLESESKKIIEVKESNQKNQGDKEAKKEEIPQLPTDSEKGTVTPEPAPVMDENKIAELPKEEGKVKSSSDIQKSKDATPPPTPPEAKPDDAPKKSAVKPIDPNEIQKQLDEKSKELTELKKSIEEKDSKSENILGEKVLFLQVVKYESDGHFTNDLWVLDPDEESGLYKSSFENICGRDFKILKTGVLVIGFEGVESDNTVHHLVLLDSETLTVKKISKENIFWRSQLFLRDGKVYAFEVSQDKKIYLSRFTEDLELEARSSEPVNLNSDISFNKSKIFVTSKLQGNEATSIMVLNKEDLKMTKNFKPSPKRILKK